MDRVNIKQLASELNLSISTVSRALSDSHEISEETKARVRELAEKLNYKPNPHATSLRSQKSRTIGLVIPEISNIFFALVIDGIEEVVQQSGYQLLIYLSHETHEKEVNIVKQISNRVDGLLICMSSESNDVSHIQELKQKNVPVVFFDRVSDRINTVKVVTNDFESGFNAGVHLIERGITKVAYLSLSMNISVDQKRMQGFLKAVHDHNLTTEQWMILNCTTDDDENYQRLGDLLASSARPDAIFACVERLAIVTYAVCKDLNLRIPADVKVIVIANLQTAAFLDPPLTTISQPAYQMGKEAASVLVNALERNLPELGNERIVLPSVLIERRSTERVPC
jgi:LacI family transcriptional regulator